MNRLYIEEAVSQITKIQKELDNVKGLLERTTGRHFLCPMCLIYVFEKDGKCPNCGTSEE